jgi:hypothetical protein
MNAKKLRTDLDRLHRTITNLRDRTTGHVDAIPALLVDALDPIRDALDIACSLDIAADTKDAA